MTMEILGRGNPDGQSIGASATELCGAYGKAVAQRSLAGISGSISTGVAVAVCSTKWGFKTSTAITKLITTVNELKATLSATGWHKGGA